MLTARIYSEFYTSRRHVAFQRAPLGCALLFDVRILWLVQFVVLRCACLSGFYSEIGIDYSVSEVKGLKSGGAEDRVAQCLYQFEKCLLRIRPLACADSDIWRKPLPAPPHPTHPLPLLSIIGYQQNMSWPNCRPKLGLAWRIANVLRECRANTTSNKQTNNDKWQRANTTTTTTTSSCVFSQAERAYLDAGARPNFRSSCKNALNNALSASAKKRERERLIESERGGSGVEPAWMLQNGAEFQDCPGPALPGCIKLIQHRGGPARSKLNVNLKHFVLPAPSVPTVPIASPALERTISTFTTDDERVGPNSNPNSNSKSSSKQMCATQQTCRRRSKKKKQQVRRL